MQRKGTVNVCLVILFLLEIKVTCSQVSISPDNSPPDNRAMLDVISTNKGILIPRVDFNNRPIPAPAGLMIFVTANGPYGDDCFYYFDGTRWKNISPPRFDIGDRIHGGVIFWLDSTRRHGLVCDLHDQADARWGCFGTFIGAADTTIGAGEPNTTAIVTGCDSSDIAARLCHNSNYSGYSDWFLPSKAEIEEMYSHRYIIGGFDTIPYTPLHSNYWSSSEIQAGSAWCYHWALPDPGAFVSGKNFYRHVRCIRKF